ncbi:SURF1 family protein [Alphaproteobacteria bacterium]|nr:SURF1 family protein [Alphaproteobacteria bacterium]
MNSANDGVAIPAAGRRGPRGFLIFAVSGIGGLIALGTWQLDRLDQKETLIADRQAMLVQPPLDFNGLTDIPDKIAYRRATVTGEFSHEKELRIGPRTRRGRAGWQVVTPFRRGTGGIILVDRGWVPDSLKNPQSRPNGQVTGIVTLTGFMMSVIARGRFVPDNDAAKGDWYWIDPATMAVHLELSNVAPYWLVAARDPSRSVGPVGVDRGAMPVNNHLQYAITWYALAALLSVLAFVYWRRASSDD